MPTINNKHIVDQVITNGGSYDEEDHQVALEVFEYTNDWGGTTWFISYSTTSTKAFLSSPAVHTPRRIWQRS